MKTSVKSKKQIALLSAGALLSLGIAATAGGLTASAATQSLSRNEGRDVQQAVTISGEVESKWTATVDDEVTLTGGKGTITFTFSNVVLENGRSLSVKAASTNGWKLKNGEEEISYDVKKGETSITSGDGTVLSNINGKSDELSAELSIEATGVESAKVAGSYTDTLTFTVTES